MQAANSEAVAGRDDGPRKTARATVTSDAVEVALDDVLRLLARRVARMYVAGDSGAEDR